MSETQEPLAAPFRIIADPSEATDGWQFAGLFDAADPKRRITVHVEYRSLEIPGYMVEELALLFVRRRAPDFAAALQQRPHCVRQEIEQLKQLEDAGTSCLIVIEGESADVERVLAEEIALAGSAADIPWLFAPTREAAELVVLSLIQRAWLERQKAGDTEPWTPPSPGA
jgi:hypothetical protein